MREVGRGEDLFRWIPVTKFWLEKEILHFLGEPLGHLCPNKGFIFFAWFAAKDKILTVSRDNFIRSRMIIVNRCCMCLIDVSMGHLSTYCLVAKELWNAVFVS